MAGQAMQRDLRLADFDYELPPQLIAQRPLHDRSASRLLHLAEHGIADLHFAQLPALLEPGDLLLLNDTRVIKARLFGSKPSGGGVEGATQREVRPPPGHGPPWTH